MTMENISDIRRMKNKVLRLANESESDSVSDTGIEIPCLNLKNYMQMLKLSTVGVKSFNDMKLQSK